MELTQEETRVVDRIVLLSKLTKLCHQDRAIAAKSNVWSPAWQEKSPAFEEAAKRLSSSLSAYVAHGIHDKDGHGRELDEYCKLASGQINVLLNEAIPQGEAATRQAVLDATMDDGVVTSVRSLNKRLPEFAEKRAELRDKLNAALRRPAEPQDAEAQGHADAIREFTEDSAQEIAKSFAYLLHHIHDNVLSASGIFLHENVGKVDPLSWSAQERAERIAAVEGDLTALDNVRAATPHERPQAPQAAAEPQAAAARPAKRKRELEDAAVVQTPGLRRLNRPRVRGTEQIKARRKLEDAGVEQTPGLRRLDRPRVRGPEKIKARKFDPRERAQNSRD
jgi:hypothetical protein